MCPDFKPYPTAKDTPNRKQRKSKRKAIFEANRVAYREARNARRDVRKGLLK